MDITRAKLVALGLAIVYLIAGIAIAGVEVVPTLAFVLLAALVFIWFADELGSYTGYAGHGPRITQTTPGVLVAAFGWIILIGLPFAHFLSP